MDAGRNEFFNVKQRKGHIITVAGKEFDCGFIPAGVEIPLLDEFHAQVEKQGNYHLPENYADLSEKEMIKARMNSATRYATEQRAQARQDNIRFVAIFTSFFDPDYTEEHLSKNATGAEINAAWQAIETTIVEDYYGAIKDMGGGGGEKKGKASARKH